MLTYIQRHQEWFCHTQTHRDRKLLLAACLLLCFQIVIGKNALTVPGIFSAGHDFRSGSYPFLQPVQPDGSITGFLAREGLNDFSSYASWAATHLSYKKDPGDDAWSSPLDTLNRRYGDCEDLAFLHLDVARRFGYTGRVLGFEIKGETHAVSVILIDGKYAVFDNTTLHADRARTIEELYAYMILKYQSRYAMALRNQPRRISLIYAKKKSGGYYFFDRL